MATSAPLPDFSAPEMPTAVKITGWANKVFWVVLASQRAVVFWTTAGVVLIVWSLTEPLRSQRPVWLQVVIVVVTAVVAMLMAYAILQLVPRPWLGRLIEGKPRFAPLVSPGRRLLLTMGRCIGRVRLSFTPEDQRLMERLAELAHWVVTQTFRSQVVKLQSESEWPREWGNIQNAKIGDITFGEASRSGMLQLFLDHYAVVIRLVAPFVAIFYAGSTLLLALWIRDRNPLGLVQFTLLMGIVVAAVTFVNFTVQLRMVHVRIDELDRRLESVQVGLRSTDPALSDFFSEHRRRVREELSIYEGREMFPVVTIKPGYIEAIRNDLVRRFLVAGLVRVLMLVPLLLVLLAAGLLASTWTRPEVLTWTGWMSLGLLVAPFAFCAALGFGFFVLARTRALLALLGAGLFIAVIPPVINYAFGGETSNTVIITSIVSGLAGILSTAVAELVKKRPSAEEADKP